METNMTNPWTPGPWRVQPGFLTVYSLSNGGVGLTCAVASVLKEQPEKGQPEANARLIAAAPELVEALEEIRAALIAESVVACNECGGSNFPKHSDCDGCTNHIDDMFPAFAILDRVRGKIGEK